jgi:hypothetical protein
VSEGVRIETDLNVDAKGTPAVLLTQKAVANETFGAWNIAVRLNGPTAYNLPTAFANALQYLSEWARIGALNPAIVCRGRMGVAKARSFSDAIERTAERSKDSIFTIAPGPEPRGIDVKVTNDVQALALLAIRNGCDSRRCSGSAQGSGTAQQKFAP